MDNKPKTKQTATTIKEHTASVAKDKAAQIGVKTKDTVKTKIEEQISPRRGRKQDQSAESSASDQVSESAERAAEEAKTAAGKATKKTIRKVRQKLVEKRQAETRVKSSQGSTDPSADMTEPGIDDNMTQPSAAEGQRGIKTRDKPSANTKTGSSSRRPQTDKKTVRGKTSEQMPIKEKQHSAPKKAFQDIPEVSEPEITPKMRKKTAPKQRVRSSVKEVCVQKKGLNTISAVPRKAKEAGHGASQTIKTADRSFKKAERTAKATKKTAEATAKAAKRSEEAARRTAKVVAKATKAAIKAVIEGIKAAVAAAKELIAAAIAGSPVAIAIIIVLALVAAIGGSCFGVFLMNDESTGTQMTLSEAIPQLTSEHYAKLKVLKSGFEYDTMEIEGSEKMSINWKDVLSVYAVKVTTSGENAQEVATLNDEKLGFLRDVISDMNKVTGVVVPKLVQETYTETDSSGNTVTKTRTVTINVLKVTAIRLSVDQIVELYHFDDNQRKQLTELMNESNDELWKELIGSVSATGDVLVTNSTYVPTDIFFWPLQENGYISSPFGYRSDPFTGEQKLHGGTDISADTGDPVLAAAEGDVIMAEWDDSYGYFVKIRHNDMFSTLYAHCSALHVTAGQHVTTGQVIADVGETGAATGPHLHFEVRIYEERVDAMQYFNR